MILKCDCCSKEIGVSNGRYIRGIKNIKVCKECEDSYVKEVKNKYFVENYKENEIYHIDNKYYPYWDCLYYFNKIEDCRERIDNSHIAITRW